MVTKSYIDTVKVNSIKNHNFLQLIMSKTYILSIFTKTAGPWALVPRYSIPLMDKAITNLFDIFPFSSGARKYHTNGVKQ